VKEGLLVGTLPQELSSLQLAGEPVMFQRKKTPSGYSMITEEPEETERSTI